MKCHSSKVSNSLMVFFVIFALGCSKQIASNSTTEIPKVSVFEINGDSMVATMEKLGQRDQIYRTKQIQEPSADSYQIDSWGDVQRKLDRENMECLAYIFDHFGYPGKAMVGKDLSHVAATVLFHAGTPLEKEKYWPLLQKAAEEGELNKNLLLLYQ